MAIFGKIFGGSTGEGQDEQQNTPLTLPPSPTVAEQKESPTPTPLKLTKVWETSIEVAKNKEDVSVETCRNYTVIAAKDGGRINLRDETGRWIETFPQGTTAIAIDWQNVSTAIGKSYLVPYGQKREADDIESGGFPSHLMHHARDLLNNKKPTEWERTEREKKMVSLSNADTTKLQIPGLPLLSVTKDGKYIVATSPKYDSDGMFIVFTTQDEHGNPLPPRNWARSDTGVAKFSSDVAGVIENHRQEKVVFANGKYKANIDRGKLKIEVNALFGEVKFQDSVEITKDTLCTDPQNPFRIYYCPSNQVSEIITVDTTGDPPWQPKSMRLPSTFARVQRLHMDPTGNFFLIEGEEMGRGTTGISVLSKDTCEVLQTLSGLSHIHFDPQGRMRAITGENKLACFDVNFGELSTTLKQRRVAQLAQGIAVQDFFQAEGERTKPQTAAQPVATLEGYKSLREQFERQFTAEITKVQKLEDIPRITKAIENLRARLRSQGITDAAELAYITGGIEQKLEDRRREIAVQTVSGVVQGIQSQLSSGGLSLYDVTNISQRLSEVQAIQSSLPDAVKQEVAALALEFGTKAKELFAKKGAEVEKDIDALVAQQEEALQKLDTKAAFDDWCDTTLPRLQRTLTEYANTCPLECASTHQKITQARMHLAALAENYTQKFREQYEIVREQAVLRTDSLIQAIQTEIEGFVDRLHGKNFRKREDAQRHIEASEVRTQLEAQIDILASRNSDAARDLRKTLQVSLANFLYEVERKGAAQTSADGREMEVFGSTPFPKFEAPVKEKGMKKVEPFFHGDKVPGVTAENTVGDLMLSITTADGKKQLTRLWEEYGEHEDEYRLGIQTYKGKLWNASRIKAQEYQTIKKSYGEWMSGKLKRAVEEKMAALESHYHTREKPKQRTAKDMQWQERYRELLEDYASFCATHAIPLLRRIEHIAKSEDPEEENGKGLVPEWKNHWVVAPEDEKILEQMAKFFKMQLDLQEGLLLLKGHAGTGKDVFLKMFAHRTHRPYFAFDCTKWTTEADLSVDILMEAEGGATKTILVPSVLVTAIQTPGALLYLNEFNAMPEVAQIFLHALMDEKRTMTIKIGSKVIKAHPSVLLAGSMNPGYAGTFAPQLATRSRMVSLDVAYPPLHREKGAGDANPNPPYSASEALKIARNVDSLSGGTMDPDMKRNEFMQWWDSTVNGIGEDQKLSQTQTFDILATLALVQFAGKLREAFINQFEGTRAAQQRSALPVHHPITLREMRRCAYFLSQMTPEEKTATTPEQIAKDLIETFFLSHIDSREDREKIKTAMATWTSQKRLAA